MKYLNLSYNKDCRVNTLTALLLICSISAVICAITHCMFIHTASQPALEKAQPTNPSAFWNQIKAKEQGDITSQASTLLFVASSIHSALPGSAQSMNSSWSMAMSPLLPFERCDRSWIWKGPGMRPKKMMPSLHARTLELSGHQTTVVWPSGVQTSAQRLLFSSTLKPRTWVTKESGCNWLIRCYPIQYIQYIQYEHIVYIGYSFVHWLKSISLC